MGTRGTKPASKAQKIAKGTRKDRINFEEPEPPALSLSTPCPVRFKEPRQKVLWKYFLNLFSEMKILSVADQAAIEELVYYKWLSEKAEKDVQEHGEVIESKNKKGEMYLSENPWINIKVKSSDRVVKLLTQFGLTPSSRSTIKVEKPKDKIQGFKGLLKIKKPA